MVAFLEDHTDRGMWHGAVVSHYSAGSVVWQVTGPLVGGPDTHGAQSRHSLFDNYNSISHHTSGGGRSSLPHHLDGYIRWNNTILSDGEPVASGVYFYTLTANDFNATKKNDNKKMKRG